jgi:hypothetical protein
MSENVSPPADPFPSGLTTAISNCPEEKLTNGEEMSGNILSPVDNESQPTKYPIHNSHTNI